MFLLHHIIKPIRSKLITPKKVFPAGSQKLEPHKKARRKCDVQERVVEDMYLYDLVPRRAAAPSEKRDTSKKKRIYWFSGGGWQMPASPNHWIMCADIAEEVRDASITLVSYPLAPNGAAPVSFGPLLKLYRRLLRDAADEERRVILAGDSAGGNIVLCLTLAALAEDIELPSPDALFVVSPSCDLRRQNPDIQVVKKYDPILSLPFVLETANKWRAEWDASDPRVTPLMGDIGLLAKKDVQVHGVVGGYDILGPDVILFRDKCEQAGVKGEWLEWDKQMHVFPLAAPYKLPESVKGKQWMVDVLRRA
jgi:acetyl esterase/lipase